MRFVLFLFFCLSIVTGPAFAQSHEDTLAGLQGELVRAAGIIRGIERRIGELDAHLESLSGKKTKLEAEYAERRSRMASTLSALTRMGRTPREAVLIRPGGPLQAARTTMLLSASFPVIEAEAKAFGGLLTDLEKTSRELSEKSAQAKAVRADLRTRHADLTRLLDARSAATGNDTAWVEEARKVAELARAARTLRDFLSGLDTGDAARAKADAFFAALPDDEGQMPVSGIIRVAYGQRDTIGAKSSGISIETLAGSLVVAPMGGIVRYAGPFRGYGNIVIIAHKGGYHSLIAGLDKINVSEGQTIVSGEPIAILEDLGDANPSASPVRKTVYYELRQGGHPVNPSRKLPGLG
ncbi:MAG: hypothetical protein EBQ96_07965 [Proteobacteria bacterium]|nr:hypothetical protein [Pseudomonadota bacterium]